MRKPIPNMAVIYRTAIIITLISTFGTAIAQVKATDYTTQAAPVNCFVQFNDGSIRQFQTLKLVTGIFVTPHLLADEKIIINAKEIKAYHSDKHFAVSDKSLITKKKGLVALETLPGFAIRLVSGKLNVYSRKYYNGNNAIDEYFLQIGSDGPIVSYTTDLMKNLLKDNAKALEYYNSKEKVSPKSKKLLASADIFNSGELLSKNR